MQIRAIQITITVAALTIGAFHQWYPEWSLDKWTMYCFIIAVLPWLAPLFKSIEIPGLKVQFQDLQNAQYRADQAGLLGPTGPETPEYSFMMIAPHDANLALAGLRIEIERRLLELAKQHNIPAPRAGVGSLLRSLAQREVLTLQEREVLADMVGLLNSAVHGASVDERATEWAMEVGPKILSGLDERIERKG